MMRLAPWLLGALVFAEAAAQPWGSPRSPSSSGEREPSERSDRDYDRESWFPRRESSSGAEARPAAKESPWTPAEARDPDLSRCDRYRTQLEALLREEMRGKPTGAQQRALHEQRMREGC
jgi:hypothetical protein